MKTIKYYYNRSLFLIKLSALIVLFSCKKFVTVDPPQTELTQPVVFSTDASARAAMDGIYSRMMSSPGFASGALQSITMLTGLSSDELIDYSNDPASVQFYQNSLDKNNNSVQSFLWNEPYQYIYTTNAIMEGIAQGKNLSASVKQELTGEAKFIRAFCYFYLVNLFGDVPLHLTTDYRITSTSGRSPEAMVYEQVITDLVDAKELLSGDFSSSAGERAKPNRWAAIALLSRVYLYTGNWQQAEAEASLVINNNLDFELLSDLNTVFLANSREAIWQLMPNQPGYNTNEGQYFILTSDPGNVALSDNLVHSFEHGDNRFADWVDSINNGSATFYFPYKYKIQTGADLAEYSMVLRFAEQFLIRSEARARQGNIAGAKEDINSIRTRAGLPGTTANDEAGLITAIIHEKQIELFTEWGNRWLDLNRTGSSDSVLGPLKSPNWQSTDMLYPIPLQEIQNNNRITQNPGY